MLFVRNVYTNKIAQAVAQGRHRVTVRLADGSYEEWLIEEADFDVSQWGAAEGVTSHQCHQRFRIDQRREILLRNPNITGDTGDRE